MNSIQLTPAPLLLKSKAVYGCPKLNWTSLSQQNIVLNYSLKTSSIPWQQSTFQRWHLLFKKLYIVDFSQNLTIGVNMSKVTPWTAQMPDCDWIKRGQNRQVKCNFLLWSVQNTPLQMFGVKFEKNSLLDDCHTYVSSN